MLKNFDEELLSFIIIIINFAHFYDNFNLVLTHTLTLLLIQAITGKKWFSFNIINNLLLLQSSNLLRVISFHFLTGMHFCSLGKVALALLFFDWRMLTSALQSHKRGKASMTFWFSLSHMRGKSSTTFWRFQASLVICYISRGFFSLKVVVLSCAEFKFNFAPKLLHCLFYKQIHWLCSLIPPFSALVNLFNKSNFFPNTQVCHP